MADLFKQIVPSILQTKVDHLQTEDDEKAYSGDAYRVNKALSYHIDCVLYANQMNMNSHLDGKLQYQYYLNTIRSMKRKFQPWQKSQADNNLECIKQYYGYSDRKAKEVLSILSDEQIAEIKRKTDKGGVKK